MTHRPGRALLAILALPDIAAAVAAARFSPIEDSDRRSILE